MLRLRHHESFPYKRKAKDSTGERLYIPLLSMTVIVSIIIIIISWSIFHNKYYSRITCPVQLLKDQWTVNWQYMRKWFYSKCFQLPIDSLFLIYVGGWQIFVFSRGSPEDALHRKWSFPLGSYLFKESFGDFCGRAWPMRRDAAFQRLSWI